MNTMARKFKLGKAQIVSLKLRVFFKKNFRKKKTEIIS